MLEVPHFNFQWSRLDIIWHQAPASSASCRQLDRARCGLAIVKSTRQGGFFAYWLSNFCGGRSSRADFVLIGCPTFAGDAPGMWRLVGDHTLIASSVTRALNSGSCPLRLPFMLCVWYGLKSASTHHNHSLTTGPIFGGQITQPLFNVTYSIITYFIYVTRNY